ncbi:hypothetical protein F2Q65_14455 [Thiohalocapsa marina]|uniref:AEC family transporter n=1 Tax=Thiohalocapsa marina TaxID=424902 RepID=A0A5M8FHF5_9GAMM|nr:AEC family transporter [Thiohalocapsa marina]KAA6183854.1 hypothetical protein F2Q65_14455 [Thiohalocapsa marina]
MQTQVVSSIVLLVALILLVTGLRRIGLIEVRHGQLFGALVTRVTLPALIFGSLAKSAPCWGFELLALVILLAELVCLAVAWLGGRLLRLSAPALGAVLLAAAFGSSSMLGYALIGAVYGNNREAIAEAVVISELGVGPALFTLGTMIALYHGRAEGSVHSRLLEALKFFRSPIFVAVVLGLSWSLLRLPTSGPLMGLLFQGVGVLGSANTFLVTLTVGALLHFEGIRSVFGLTVLVATIKLLLQPGVAWLAAIGLGATGIGAIELGLADAQAQILILEAAMPSALLAVVLANTYGCDGHLASKLVLATTVASIVTLPLMVQLLR